MLAYMTLAATDTKQSQSTQSTQATTHNSTDLSSVKQEHSTEHRVTHSLIEKCVGLFQRRRSHRNAKDFDGKYLNNIFVNEVVEEMSKFPKMEPS